MDVGAREGGGAAGAVQAACAGVDRMSGNLSGPGPRRDLATHDDRWPSGWYQVLPRKGLPLAMPIGTASRPGFTGPPDGLLQEVSGGGQAATAKRACAARHARTPCGQRSAGPRQQASYVRTPPSRVHGCFVRSNFGRPCTLYETRPSAPDTSACTSVTV